MTHYFPQQDGNAHLMNTSLGKYILQFVLIYTAVLVAAGALAHFFEIGDIRHGPQIIISLLAAAFVSEKFVKDNMRAPNKAEKYRLIAYSFFYSHLIAFFAGAGFYAALNIETQKLYAEKMENISSFLFAFLTIAFLAFQIFFLHKLYGELSEKMLKDGKKEQNKKP